MRIAIVGTGVSGLVAAHQLHPHHDLTVFEVDARVGGHANTVDVEIDGVTHGVDTGFIVYNDANYPGFASLLAGTRRRDAADRDELQRRRRPHGPRIPGFEPQHTVRATAESDPALVPAAPRRHSPVQPRRAPARRGRSPLAGFRPPSLGRRSRGRRVRVDRIVHRARRLLPRVRGAVPRAARRRDLVGGPGDVHGFPDAFVRPLHAQPRSARRAGADAVAHGYRWFAPLRRRTDRAVRESHPARDPRAEDRRSRTAWLPRRRGPDRSGARAFRSRHRRDAQRPGAPHDRRPHTRGTFGARCDPLPAEHRHAAHRPAHASDRTAGARELELRDRSAEPARHDHVLDELAAGDRQRATTARHPQSLRCDRSPPGHRRVRVSASRLRRRGDARPASAPRDPRSPRCLVRGRLLGLRVPRGRRAEWARSRRAISGER